MKKQSPYKIITSRYVTEKSQALEELKNNTNNPCVARCKLPKYVFLVDPNANKFEIARALEEIYAEKSIKVASVNTITMKPKKRRVRGKTGYASGFKKAIITLNEGDSIE